MDPFPPEAGTVEPGASKATEHLDSAEGEVTVFPDEPQPDRAIATARPVTLAAKTASRERGRAVCILVTAVVAAGEEQVLSKCPP
jgi:hypothetical protein